MFKMKTVAEDHSDSEGSGLGVVYISDVLEHLGRVVLQTIH